MVRVFNVTTGFEEIVSYERCDSGYETREAPGIYPAGGRVPMNSVIVQGAPVRFRANMIMLSTVGRSTYWDGTTEDDGGPPEPYERVCKDDLDAAGLFYHRRDPTHEEQIKWGRFPIFYLLEDE